MAYALALYVGQGTWKDGLIRWVTRSLYSHVELADVDCAIDGQTLCWSASPRDGGVRCTMIDLRSGRWEIVPIEAKVPRAFAMMTSEDGKGYDWFGLIFSQFFNWRRQDKRRWFCSELIAASLDLPRPAMWSPGDLKAMVERMNRAVARNHPNMSSAGLAATGSVSRAGA